MERDKKKSNESVAIMSEIVLPNDTNNLNNLMGGRLLYWMDIVAGIAAQRHANSRVVTVSVDNVSFKNPIRFGNTVTLTAKVSKAFSTSMEVYIEVTGENYQGQCIQSNTAFFTMVAIDDLNKPTLVPELVPETDYEKLLFESAENRRKVRLFLAGKLTKQESLGLEKIFAVQ